MHDSALRANLSRLQLNKPLYVSSRDVSLTSLGEIIEGRTKVYFDKASGHLQTAPLISVAEYYDNDYKILIASANEDQFYEERAGRTVYRSEHQLQILLEKITFCPQSQVLDYGCAKGAMTRILKNARSDISPYLFDVSEMYRPFWDEIVPPAHQATYQTPLEWKGKFDVVMSFFVFEHVEEPITLWRQIRDLLRPGGAFYGIVPNTLTNTADFIVADHINHFSELSLRYALTRAGFVVEDIDTDSHRGAFVVVARRMEVQSEINTWSPNEEDVKRLYCKVEEIAALWSDMGERIREFEDAHNKGRSAIYGSGFYGTFISSCLRNTENISCFLDMNPFQQGKVLQDRQVLAPENLPEDVETIYVGLNPSIARQAMSTSALSQRSNLHYFYL